MLPDSFWRGIEYEKQHNAKVKPNGTLDWHVKCNRSRIKDTIAEPVRDTAIIENMILLHAPREPNKIELFLKGLQELKSHCTLAEDTDFYQTQIRAFELLLYHIRVESLP
jgi:hypothetical protein